MSYQIKNIVSYASSKVLKRLAYIIITMMMVQQVQGQAVTSRAYRVKAAFLYNFTQFVEWPESSLGSPNSPFTVGILGVDPFGPYLDSLLANEKVGNHPMTVQRFDQSGKVQNCQILFINLPVIEAVDVLLFKNEPILTVSDDSDLMKFGGIVRFFTKDNKIKLQINAAAAKSSNLMISSKLLRLAEIYTE